MRIQINPRSLSNLEDICEVLYKLHPSVLDDLVEMERSLGNVLGIIDSSNLSLEEREFLANNNREVDYSKEPKELSLLKEEKEINEYCLLCDKIKERKKKEKELLKKIDDPKVLLKQMEEMENHENGCSFYELRKYLQLDTYEYIPMKIYVEVEDPVIGKKVKELVKALEKTRAPEQFYFHKKEVDVYAYFAEGYGLKMNEEQKKKMMIFIE